MRTSAAPARVNHMSCEWAFRRDLKYQLCKVVEPTWVGDPNPVVIGGYLQQTGCEFKHQFRKNTTFL